MPRTKFNWCISTGTDDGDLHRVKIIKNMTKIQLGNYIKYHVRILFDYFAAISCETQDANSNKLAKMLFKLMDKYGSLVDLDNETFPEVVHEISKKLINNFTNEQIVNEFISIDNYHTTRISKLLVSSHKLYDYEPGYYQGSADSDADSFSD